MKKITSLIFAAVMLFSSGAFSQTNLIDGWDGGDATGEASIPANLGWDCTATDVPWQEYEGGGGVRLTDQTYTYNGTSWSGRVLFLRWESGNISTSDVFSYPVELEAGKSYTFAGKYAWHSNSDGSTVFTFSINSEKNNSGDMLAYKETPGITTMQVLYEESMSFVAPATGTYYLTIGCNNRILSAITDLSIVEDENVEVFNVTKRTSIALIDSEPQATFMVTYKGLAEDISLSVSNAAITISPSSISKDDTNNFTEVTVSFDGTQNLRGEISVSSGEVTYTIPVTASNESCFVPLTDQYSDLVGENLVPDPYLNSLEGFAGWGSEKSINYDPEYIYCGIASGALKGTGVSLDAAGFLKPYTTYRSQAMVYTNAPGQMRIGGYGLGKPDEDHLISEFVTEGEGEGTWVTVDFTFTTLGRIQSGNGVFLNTIEGNTVEVETYIDNWQVYEVNSSNSGAAVLEPDEEYRIIHSSGLYLTIAQENSPIKIRNAADDASQKFTFVPVEDADTEFRYYNIKTSDGKYIAKSNSSNDTWSLVLEEDADSDRAIFGIEKDGDSYTIFNKTNASNLNSMGVDDETNNSTVYIDKNNGKISWKIRPVNLIANWNGGTKTGADANPVNLGWESTATDVPWNDFAATGGVRLIQTDYSYEGDKDWSGRILYLRWESGNITTSDVFSYPVELEAGKAYSFTGKYAWNSNGTDGQADATFTFGINSEKDNSGEMLAQETPTITTADKERLYDVSFSFVASETATYYLTIGCNNKLLSAIADLSIMEDNDLVIFSATPTTVVLTDSEPQATFTVTRKGLTEDVVLSTMAQGITITPAIIPQDDDNLQTEITVDFDGSKNIYDSITIACGDSVITVSLVASVENCLVPLTEEDDTLIGENLVPDPYLNSLEGFGGWGEERGITYDSAFVYCGVASAYLKGKAVSLDVTGFIKPNTTYRVQAMVYTDAPDSVKIGAYGFGPDTYSYISELVEGNAENTWATVDFTFTSKYRVDAANGVFINVENKVTDTETYIDNWQIYEVDKEFEGLAVFDTDKNYNIIYSAGQYLNASAQDGDHPVRIKNESKTENQVFTLIPVDEDNAEIQYYNIQASDGKYIAQTSNASSYWNFMLEDDASVDRAIFGIEKEQDNYYTIYCKTYVDQAGQFIGLNEEENDAVVYINKDNGKIYWTIVEAAPIVTDLNNPQSQNGYTVYSSEGRIIVNFDLQSAENIEFAVYTSNGLLIENVSENFVTGNNQKTIGNKLAPGVYFVKVKSSTPTVAKVIVK